jgi:hypothetical protein
MAKLKGQHCTIFIDDSGLSPQDVSDDIESIDIPDEYDEIEVTGFTEGAHNSIPGMPKFDVEFSGTFNPAATTGLYTVLAGIKGVASGHTLTVQVPTGTGAPASGDPEFEGEFWLQKMNIATTPAGKINIVGSLRVFGATAPAWGTVA